MPGQTAGGRPACPPPRLLTDEERATLTRQSRAFVHGRDQDQDQDQDNGDYRNDARATFSTHLLIPLLFEECHGLLGRAYNAQTRSLETLCEDVAVVRNLVCGGAGAVRLVEGEGTGDDNAERPEDTDRREDTDGPSLRGPGLLRLVRLLVGVVDTYFDANAVDAIDEGGVSGLLEEVNVRLLARLRRLTCQVVVNACSSSFTWRRAIGTSCWCIWYLVVGTGTAYRFPLLDVTHAPNSPSSFISLSLSLSLSL